MDSLQDQTKTPEPSEWPEHISLVANCPCSDAVPTTGIVYRWINGSNEDHKSYVEQGKVVAKSKRCQGASLTCYRDINHCRAVMALRLEWSQAQLVAADLSEEHGVIQQTGNDPKHYSLWLRKKHLTNINSLFRVVL